MYLDEDLFYIFTFLIEKCRIQMIPIHIKIIGIWTIKVGNFGIQVK